MVSCISQLGLILTLVVAGFRFSQFS
ncbi:uncharacterized protein METZ01_LOCUS273882, partial [marine metagenome]